MLSKKYSIQAKYYKTIYKKGIFKFNPNFNINYLPNNKDYSQFGVIISKKTAKLAVTRNKLRRIVKSWVRQSLSNIPKGYFIVINLKKNFVKDDKTDIIKQDLQKLLLNL